MYVIPGVCLLHHSLFFKSRMFLAACEYISLLYVKAQWYYHVFSMPHLTKLQWMIYYISNIYFLHQII